MPKDYAKKMDYVRAADRIDRILGAIDLLADLLVKDDEFLRSLRGSNTRGKVRHAADELWTVTDILGEVSTTLKQKPKSD
jgi:hypothetical protein